MRFEGVAAGKPVLEAIEFLRAHEGEKKPDMAAAPLALAQGVWRRIVVDGQGHVDRRAYTLCVVECLQDALRRRDVFVAKSDRWGDPRAKLLEGEEWKSARPRVCRALGLERRAETELQELTRTLAEAYQRTVANPHARQCPPCGRPGADSARAGLGRG